jgi:hypothetical protein
MATPSFYQQSRIGRVIFRIRDGALFISALPLIKGESRTEYRMDLRQLDSNYTPRIARDHALLAIPALVVLLMVSGIWALRRQTYFPQVSLVFFYEILVVGFISSLVLAIKGSRRIEYYEFRNHWGKTLLNIICEREQKADCDEFIQELVSHIEIAQSDLPAKERSLILAELDGESKPAPHLDPSWPRWSLCIALGALGSGLPLLPGEALSVDPSVIIFVFPLCVGGLIAGYFSFQKRESKCWWSIVGLILSLLPPFFY